MKVILIKREISPGWAVIKKDVPLGKEYTLLSPREREFILNDTTGMFMSFPVLCLFVEDDNGAQGYIPKDLLEFIEEEN